MKIKLHTTLDNETQHLFTFISGLKLLGGRIERLQYVHPLRVYFIEVSGTSNAHLAEYNNSTMHLDFEIFGLDFQPRIV